MELSELYKWEIQTVDGEVFKRGGALKWQDIDRETVLRASLVPQVDGLQRVDVFCSADNRFIGWFGKGFLKQANNFQLSEYVQCIETEQSRVWAFSDGGVMVTHADFELRI